MIEHLDSDQGLSAGHIYTNAGAEGGIRLDLPPALEEAEIVVAIHAPHRVLLVADSGDRVYLGTQVTASGGGVESSQPGSLVRFFCAKQGYWSCLLSGDWTVSGL